MTTRRVEKRVKNLYKPRNLRSVRGTAVTTMGSRGKGIVELASQLRSGQKRRENLLFGPAKGPSRSGSRLSTQRLRDTKEEFVLFICWRVLLWRVRCLSSTTRCRSSARALRVQNIISKQYACMLHQRSRAHTEAKAKKANAETNATSTSTHADASALIRNETSP